jgi:hypothetical protein
MIRFIARALLGALPAVLLASTSSSVAAQSTSPVTVALVKQLPDSAVATIVRAPSPRSSGRTVVLLREDGADVAAITSAMMAVFKARQVLGDTVASRMVLSVYGRRPAGSVSPNERRLAEYYLARLRTARESTVEGLGSLKSVQIAIAPASRIPIVRK